MFAPKKMISNAKRAAESSDASDKDNAGRAEEAAAGDEVDPNEPRYCLCGDVSYGEMVGCDNDDASFFSTFLTFVALRESRC